MTGLPRATVPEAPAPGGDPFGQLHELLSHQAAMLVLAAAAAGQLADDPKRTMAP